MTSSDYLIIRRKILDIVELSNKIKSAELLLKIKHITGKTSDSIRSVLLSLLAEGLLEVDENLDISLSEELIRKNKNYDVQQK